MRRPPIGQVEGRREKSEIKKKGEKERKKEKKRKKREGELEATRP